MSDYRLRKCELPTWAQNKKLKIVLVINLCLQNVLKNSGDYRPQTSDVPTWPSTKRRKLVLVKTTNVLKRFADFRSVRRLENAITRRGPKMRNSNLPWRNVYVFKRAQDFLAITIPNN